MTQENIIKTVEKKLNEIIKRNLIEFIQHGRRIDGYLLRRAYTDIKDIQIVSESDEWTFLNCRINYDDTAFGGEFFGWQNERVMVNKKGEVYLRDIDTWHYNEYEIPGRFSNSTFFDKEFSKSVKK